MTKQKTLTTLAGAVALAFAIAAAPAVFSQQDEKPMGDQPMHMHHGEMHHGQMGEMPEACAEMMEAHQAKMAEHKAAMEAHRARMDELVAEMNQATGDAKVDAVAAVLSEMWSQHESMQDGMGMMGGMACMGKMGGHGMMGGHDGCGCAMHGEGGCPMMKDDMEGMEDDGQ